MAEGALDSDRAERAVRIEKTGQTNNRVQLEQGESRGGVLEIDSPKFQCRDQVGRQRVYVHFEADGQRSGRAYTRPYAAKLCAFDGLVEVKRVTPEGFIAECVETKSLPALIGQLLGVFTNNRVKP